MDKALRSEKAFITDKGIKLNNLHYTNTLAIKEQWFMKAVLSGEWEMVIKYHPNDIGVLFLPDHDYEICYVVQTGNVSQEELKQYHSLIELYKKSKLKIDRLKRGRKYGG